MCFELCPHCEYEVELPDNLGVYKCPVCGLWIVNCSQCKAFTCDEFCSLPWKASCYNKRENNDN